MKSICVFCGSQKGNDPIFEVAARNLGRVLAEQEIELIYGGGRTGLMGLLADSVLENGGQVQGVIPEFLQDRELAHTGLSKLHLVHSMHERKQVMEKLSNAFIAMPGGFGTLEEVMEILTWAQLGLHKKPIGILNIHNYFDCLEDLFNRMETAGFIQKEHRSLAQFSAYPTDLIDQLRIREEQVKANLSEDSSKILERDKT
jgi:hypothetical protein